MLEMPQMVQTWKEVCCAVFGRVDGLLMLGTERTWSWMEEVAEISWLVWRMGLCMCLESICTNTKMHVGGTAGVGCILVPVYINSTRTYENVRSFEAACTFLEVLECLAMERWDRREGFTILEWQSPCKSSRRGGGSSMPSQIQVSWSLYVPLFLNLYFLITTFIIALLGLLSSHLSQVFFPGNWNNCEFLSPSSYYTFK
jgi:hypothetical protein